MTFTALVITHNQPEGLAHILKQLSEQTRQPDQTVVLWSGDEPEYQDGLTYMERPDFNDWGHDKRAVGIELAVGDYLGFFNADDSYEPDYLEEMLDPDFDVSYCDWKEVAAPVEFKLESSNSGNFIIRTEVARRIGWTGRHYQADGEFIDAVSASGASIRHVPKVLYHHNVLT